MIVRNFYSNCVAILAAQYIACPYALATIVVIQSPSNTYFGAGLGSNSLDIDIDGNGVNDFRLVAGTAAGSSGGSSLAINAIGSSSAVLGLPPFYANDLGSDAYPVPFGTLLSIQDPTFSTYAAEWFEDDVITIDNPGGGFPGSGTVEFRAGSILYGVADRGIIGAPNIISGLWRPGDRKALGIQFVDSDGNLHYGWMDLTIESPFGLRIHGWAYEETPNTLVSTFAIPEISTHALSLSAMTVCMLRRRR